MCPENFIDVHRKWGPGETGDHVLSESLILLVIKDKHTSHQETDLCTLVLDRRATGQAERARPSAVNHESL